MLAGESRQHVWHLGPGNPRGNVCRASGIVALAVATISPVAWSRQQCRGGCKRTSRRPKRLPSIRSATPCPGRTAPPGNLAVSPAVERRRAGALARRKDHCHRRPRAHRLGCGHRQRTVAGRSDVNSGSTPRLLPTARRGILTRQLPVLHTGKAERGGGLGNLSRPPRSTDGQIAEEESRSRWSKLLDRSTSRRTGRSWLWEAPAAWSFAISRGNVLLRNRQRSRRPVRFRQRTTG